MYYQIALHGRRDLPLAPDEYAGFSMSLMRMLAFRPAEVGAVAAPLAAKKKPETPGARSATVAAPAPARPGIAAGDQRAGSGARIEPGVRWQLADARQSAQGQRRRQAARAAKRVAQFRRREHGTGPGVLAAKHLADRVYQDKLRAALQEHFGKSVALKIVIGEISGNTAAVQAQSERQARQGKALEAIHGDAFVRDLMDTFDATIVSDSVKPT